MAKDVIVVVQRDALPTEKESLDILLVSTAGAYPVAEYMDIESVKKVFGDGGASPNAKIVRKVTTLFNQGKTSLADTLITKVKIVGLATPTSSAATAATFVITFDSGNLASAIAANEKVYARIGGDNNTKIELTASSEVKTGKSLASLFTGMSFTKDGKTYTATVSNNVVTFTASEKGAVDTIPALVNLYSDTSMATELAITATPVFTNGAAAMTAVESFINALERFQNDVDDDWYFILTDRDEEAYVTALAKFAESSEPSEAELGAGAEDHRKFYMGQTANKAYANPTARAAVIYTDPAYINEEPDASYTGNVGPFYPNSVTWKFKRPQNGNAASSEGTKLISLPKLTEAERNTLVGNHVNFLTEEYKRQYVKEGVCLDGEFIDVVLGGDWIAKTMRNLLYDILLENPSIEYSDAGFGLVATAVIETLANAVDLGIIAKDPDSGAGVYSVNVPKYADSTEEQHSNRIVPDITWEAQLAGAIHQVKTKGVLRTSL